VKTVIESNLVEKTQRRKSASCTQTITCNVKLEQSNRLAVNNFSYFNNPPHFTLSLFLLVVNSRATQNNEQVDGVQVFRPRAEGCQAR